MKIKFTEKENAMDSINVKNAMNFVEVENSIKVLTQEEKSIDYDMSECNLLFSDSLQGNFTLYLEKPYQNIEELINNPDKKLREILSINMSDVQDPILKHKNKVFVKVDYSGKIVSGSYAYILELVEPKKLMVGLVYKILDNPVSTYPRPITKEDSTEITIPEFDNDLGKFIQENINYPESAKKDSIKGAVVVTFWVETDLTTSGYEIIKSIREDVDKEVYEEFDNEALRVAKLISFKNPAFQYGEPIRYKMTIPVNFKL